MTEIMNARQKEIMGQLHINGEVKVAELREVFEVTEMTVRRDLEKLEQIGLAKRTFGGAILASKDVALRVRSTVMLDEKIAIGRRAAALIEPGDAIFIDGGTTTLQIARFLPMQAPITVITNALNVAAELAEKKIPTIVIGGILVETTNSMVGPVAVEIISRMAFDKVFLGATGINAEHGFSNSNMYEAEIKRIAIHQCRASYVVLDHTKFGERVLVSFADLDQVHNIVTDCMPEGELLDAVQAAGLEIIVAGVV